LAELDNRWQLPEDGPSLERQIRFKSFSRSHGVRELPGRALAAEAAAAAQNPYHEWIEPYAASGFEDLAATLERACASGMPKIARLCAQPIDAMQLELASFGAYARDSRSR